MMNGGCGMVEIHFWSNLRWWMVPKLEGSGQGAITHRGLSTFAEIWYMDAVKGPLRLTVVKIHIRSNPTQQTVPKL